jgi:hypothetical protein
MGCGSFGVDPEIAKILLSLDEKIEDFDKTFIEEAKKVKDDLDKEIESRHEKLEEYKKSQEGITEKRLKELNKKELEKEIDILSNGVDKMHYIFDVGLELVEPIRKVTLDKLLEKAKSAPAIALNKINAQIEEVKNIPVIDFLNSTYGKVLKDAMAKKGLSETLLVGVKKEIMKKRGERRKAEREEFGIKENEFEKEDISQLKLNLMDLIQNEYKDINKHFKAYVRDKIIEAIFSD